MVTCIPVTSVPTRLTAGQRGGLYVTFTKIPALMSRASNVADGGDAP